MHFWPPRLKSQNKLSYPGHNCYQFIPHRFLQQILSHVTFLTKMNNLLVLRTYFHLLKRESSQ